ncbi:CubicO group peptidase (beta-lactamase class C family) [Kitasatospora kifunensis]|uniref:CubicO group peptidase (Beta-lactamase class C family) n=1 Tax=Kitasatospora kifunensis TaxID=58351 RepID=A0A7W7R9K8_KITKI|nr:CubicO group peptidase (beta-lactamase class C family) [Kitasatospora kifunensis]
MTRATAFALGSVTKAFTATLIAHLVSVGELDLDDPVGEYLAEFEGAAERAISSITLRNLLSHTAGLVADHELDDVDEASLARYSASVAATDPLHEPGSCFSYSNSGYNILGRIIETVTDLKWQAALEELLLRPLGIEPLFPGRPGSAARALAACHVVRPGQRTARPVGLFLPPSWAPASGLAASAEDLIAFARLHLGTHPGSDALLGAAQRAEMSARVPAADAFGMADGWGSGLALYASAEGDWLGHDGTVDGGTAHLRFHPRSGTAVALTTNSTTGTLLWAAVVDLLREDGLPVGDYRPQVPDPAVAVADPGQLVGTYRNGDTHFAVRRQDDGQGLRLSDGTGLVAELTLRRHLIFTARRLDADEASYTGRFVTDPATGQATLLQLGGRSARRVAAA